jgi:hypothetical protein
LAQQEAGAPDGVKTTDPLTGIEIAKYQIEDGQATKGGFTFGFALPKKNGTDEYIGHVVRITNIFDSDAGC